VSERGELRALSGFVRLESLDLLDYVWSHPLDSASLLREPLGRSGNRELRLVRRGATIREHKLPREMIQSRTKVVQSIPENHSAPERDFHYLTDEDLEHGVHAAIRALGPAGPPTIKREWLPERLLEFTI
jgi:hypothetical protein